MRFGGALLMVVGGCAALAGCATGSDSGPLWTARERGYALFQRQCSSCHNTIGPASPVGAPPFAELGRRYNALSFERRVNEIARGRHDIMPAVQLSPDEASDLAAYIAGLAVRPAPCEPTAEANSCSR